MVVDATSADAAARLAEQLTASSAAHRSKRRLVPCTSVSAVSGSMVFEVSGADTALAADAEVLAELSDLALIVLGRSLPGAHLVASWAVAPDPYQARHRLAVADLDGPARDLGHRVRMPAVSDMPFARVCTECRQDVAVQEKDRRFVLTGHRRRDWLCEDCRRREARGPDEARLEVRVRERVSRQIGRPLSAPRMFTDLFAAAAPGSADAPGRSGARSTQVATIAADVNGLGALMGRLHSQGRPEHARRISEALDETVTWALTAGCVAAVEAMPDIGMLPAVPHVLGGDDLLVTVAADVAWPLVHRVHEVFADQAGPLAQAVADAGEDAPRLSLGLVFSHAELPVSEQIEAADALLRRAKTDHGGAASSVLWLDATTEGLDPVRGRVAWTVERLAATAEAVGTLRALPPTTRRTLVEDLADPDPLLACALLRHRLTRRDHGLAAAVRTLAATLDAACRDVLELPLRPEAHREAAERLRQALQDALSLARWWR
jgi:hypothetical protein